MRQLSSSQCACVWIPRNQKDIATCCVSYSKKYQSRNSEQLDYYLLSTFFWCNNISSHEKKISLARLLWVYVSLVSDQTKGEEEKLATQSVSNCMCPIPYSSNFGANDTENFWRFVFLYVHGAVYVGCVSMRERASRANSSSFKARVFRSLCDRRLYVCQKKSKYEQFACTCMRVQELFLEKLQRSKRNQLYPQLTLVGFSYFACVAKCLLYTHIVQVSLVYTRMLATEISPSQKGGLTKQWWPITDGLDKGWF